MLWPRLHQRNQSSPGATHPPQPHLEPHHSPQPPFSRGAVIYKLRKVARLPERTDHLPPSSPPSSSLTPFLYIRALSFYSFYYISISLSSVCVIVCGGVCLRCRSAANQGPGRLSPFSSVAGHRPPGASWLPVRTSVCVCLCEPLGAGVPPPFPVSILCAWSRLGAAGVQVGVSAGTGVLLPGLGDLSRAKSGGSLFSFSLLLPLNPQTVNAKTS